MPTQQPPTRLLIVSSDSFTAGAVWQKLWGIWSCTHAAPILRWMKGMSVDKAKIALLRMDATWSWEPISGPLRKGQAHCCLPPNPMAQETRSTNTAQEPTNGTASVCGNARQQGAAS